MREENFPRPVSDPELEGVPEYADQDSTAWDDVESPRISDGLDPAPVPGDRPLGLDHYGVTPEEARLGESLDYKIDREVPDTASDPSAIDEDAAVTADADAPDPDTALVFSDPPVSTGTDSAVSTYDATDDLFEPGDPVGRLVEPDEGAHPDEEADAIAYDADAAGGGPSAEELAMHETPEP
jgi:Family of unknown function (DUF5709)